MVSGTPEPPAAGRQSTIRLDDTRMSSTACPRCQLNAEAHSPFSINFCDELQATTLQNAWETDLGLIETLLNEKVNSLSEIVQVVSRI